MRQSLIETVINATNPSWIKRKLLKLYLSSPTKVQYTLAKYGIKGVLKKKS